MAVQNVPHITLTDPQNNDSAPSPAQSPIKAKTSSLVVGTVDSERPATPPRSSISTEGRVSNDGGEVAARPDTASSSRTSKLRRAASNGATSKQDLNSGSSEAPTQMDPLSQHILQRTHTPNPNLANRRPPTPDSPENGDSGSVPAIQKPASRIDSSETAHKDLKKGVKAVSFLSRLIGNKRKEDEETADDTSSISDQRPEGNNAEIFAQPMDGIGYSPQHASPPGYIKVRTKYKTKREFDRLFLAQQLYCRKQNGIKRTESNKLHRKTSATPQGENTIWAMEFSRDGKYMAAAGVDMIVRVWKVLSSSDDRQQHESQEKAEAEGLHGHLSAPVFQSQPVHEFQGHTSTILDLSWSKNNFLLSSSMDKTVRLWHLSRSECLCTFKHHDFVPSICFHPKDDRFFLAGSLDSKLRLWSIPDKSVAYIAKLPDLITAVAFTPDGRNAVAGCLSGLCMFFETEGLKYYTQIHVRSTRGQNARGSKITGIQAHQVHTGETKLLITSNDSRIRLYNFRDKSLELKFKGNENNCSQIRATLSDDGRYVICGSEDNKAYIWSLASEERETARRAKQSVEIFDAHDTIATAVCFAPLKTRHLLSKSEDPIYDLCNPPPVMLTSRAKGADSHQSSIPSRPTSMAESIQQTPAETESAFAHLKRPEQPSPAYISRSAHKEGNIIVTADYNGNIKVFRQDCAWSKRRASVGGEDWDRMSLFSKRGSRSNGSSGMIRTGSVATKASQPSLRDARTSMSSEGGSGIGPAARIMSWRQGVSSSPSVAEGVSGRNHKGGVGGGDESSGGSVSPRKPVSLTGKQKSGLQHGTMVSVASDSSPPLSVPDVVPDQQLSHDGQQVMAQVEQTPVVVTNDDFRSNSYSYDKNRDENPLLLFGGRSYHFWDTEQWRERARAARDNRRPSPTPSPHSSRVGITDGESLGEGKVNTVHLDNRPAFEERESYVSRLSDELESFDDTDRDDEVEGFEDAREGFGDEDVSIAASLQQNMYCRACGAEAFTASKGDRGNVVLVCGSCNQKV